jgi:hypothetical protein
MHSTNHYTRKLLKRKDKPDILRTEKSIRAKLNHEKIRYLEDELDEELRRFLNNRENT